jgi:hypothetical protein
MLLGILHDDGENPYQSIRCLFLKKPPFGPSSGNVASQTMVSAPSWTLSEAAAPPILVRTQPGHAAFTFTLPRTSDFGDSHQNPRSLVSGI